MHKPFLFVATLMAFVVFDVSLLFGQQVVSLDTSVDTIEAQLHISSSSGAVGGPFFGININNFLGANRFYSAGYTGSTAIQANIEAGHISNTHETLTHVTTFVTGSGALGNVDGHATNAGSAMAGRRSGNYLPSTYFEEGIGKGATTWSGAIATAFGGGGSFSLSNASTATTYSTILQSGVGGRTADVFNSSWGFSDPTGFNVLTVGVDGLINSNRTVGVFSAGNSGPGSNTVGGIAAGYNSIAVGALASDTSVPAYNSASSFSSRGPNDFVLATSPTGGTLIRGVRAEVDISAPGQNLTLASSFGSNFYNVNAAGTSFSAPLVAGGASLVVDAGNQLYGTADAIDGRVVKAVLLNAADKTLGWTNGQTNVGGVIETTQSLDYATGAGRMNLDRTFDQYVDIANGGLAGTTDVAGLSSGDLGNVGVVGWDFGRVLNSGSNTYFIDQMLEGGSLFTATLNWFADRNSGSSFNFAGVAEEHLANLNLEIFRFDNLISRSILSTVARSLSLYNVVEHLNFLLPRDGWYGLRVVHAGSHWNFTNQTGEEYGLAWSSVAGGVPVPEPSSLVLLGVGGLLGLCLQRRRRRLVPVEARGDCVKSGNA